MDQSYIVFSEKSIQKVVEKPDVTIVYLTNGEHWLCDNKVTPIKIENKIKYKLATK